MQSPPRVIVQWPAISRPFPEYNSINSRVYNSDYVVSLPQDIIEEPTISRPSAKYNSTD